MLGIALLQQMEDLTDEATIRQFAFNIEWHYALNVTDPSDVNAYVSIHTLRTMREQVGELGLAQSLFENVTEALAKLVDLDPSRQRIDSVHIFSNMAHLGRIRLFVKTIRKFLVNLKRHHAASYSTLGELALRYEEKNDGQFAVKPSESSRTLQQVGDDCFALVELFKNHDNVLKMDSYKLLVQLFGEQCVVETTGTVPKEISLADFVFSADDEILSCPQGQKTQRIKTGNRGGKIVHFNKADCDYCPRQSECPVKRVKHSATLRYDAKLLRLSRRRAHEKTAAFIEGLPFPRWGRRNDVRS